MMEVVYRVGGGGEGRGGGRRGCRGGMGGWRGGRGRGGGGEGEWGIKTLLSLSTSYGPLLSPTPISNTTVTSPSYLPTVANVSNSHTSNLLERTSSVSRSIPSCHLPPCKCSYICHVM